MGQTLTSSMIDVQFEKQRVKDAFFQQFDFAKLIAANADVEINSPSKSIINAFSGLDYKPRNDIDVEEVTIVETDDIEDWQ
jgi:hypothetical protein